ncbi:DMT family transporter [Pseudoprimorskyibacter insulae]|uniref:Putative cystine transporter YijE n=1 Tax=Pseudoprimorskyibacter insulae TaxID=1695997 RepID=A0A2R8AWG1_9RHOB|nr:DMT family transporter [Pseudoprimorskyibacter insulae]SPF80204.1 putative cystine transporter YijE [Pseudoprimorskyibacter insulae]
MQRKDSMDALGASAMIVFATILAVNQVVVKLTNTGLSPVFSAGLRSALSLGVVLIWVLLRGKRLGPMRAALWPGLALGACFSTEFLFLFTALDLTTVSRASIMFYSMPVWLTLAAHFLLPGERLNRRKGLGLILAMGGVVLALADPGAQGQGDLRGDLFALFGAVGWAAIALIVRLTRAKDLTAEGQLVWQLGVSAIVLLCVAPLFGPVIREFQPYHAALMAYQVILVASFGFLFWFYWMMIYPASDIASFSFLSPVLSVAMGWLLLGEHIGVDTLIALGLVAAGITLINRRPKRQVPQKVA